MTTKFYDTKLLDAVKSGRLVPARSALASGANPSLVDPATLMPLAHISAKQKQFDILRELLSAGADTTARDREGRTLMRRCVEDGIPEAARIAIGHNADLSEIDHARDTLLHSACARGRKGLPYFDIAKQLIDAGASLTAKNERGEIPLHHAARYGGDRITSFLAKVSDLANADVDGHTPLHAAALGVDNEDGARALIAANAILDAKDRNGQTPIHLIAGKTRTRPTDIAVAKLLIAAGTNLWVRDRDGLTAHEVAESGYGQRREVHQELVTLLKPKGVEPPREPFVPREKKGK